MQLSHWKDELLACGGAMPDELFDRILARGEAARETLLAIATDADHRGGDAAFHALELLAEMPEDDATTARLVASLVERPLDVECDALIDALPDSALPLVVAALDKARSAAAVFVLADAVETLGGELTTAHRRKLGRLERREESAAPIEPAAAPEDFDDAAPAKVGPNEPCPCGSGRKFKKCCEASP
jgi:hypothetical protein